MIKDFKKGQTYPCLGVQENTIVLLPTTQSYANQPY